MQCFVKTIALFSVLTFAGCQLVRDSDGFYTIESRNKDVSKRQQTQEKKKITALDTDTVSIKDTKRQEIDTKNIDTSKYIDEPANGGMENKQMVVEKMEQVVREAKDDAKHPNRFVVETSANNEEKTVADVIDEMTDEQKNVMYYLIGKAIDEKGGAASDDDDDDDTDEEEEEDMKHNAFENDAEGTYLSHEDMKGILTRAKQLGSMREAVDEAIDNGVITHAADDDYTGRPITATYGVNNIDYLMPEYHNLNNPPACFFDRCV